MSEELNQKISQLSSILGQDKLPDNIKNLISSLSNSSTTDNIDKNNKFTP